MATQLHLHLTLVVPDDTRLQDVTRHLAGRELGGVPGSWVATAELLTPGECDVDDYDEVMQAEADADAGLRD